MSVLDLADHVAVVLARLSQDQAGRDIRDAVRAR